MRDRLVMAEGYRGMENGRLAWQAEEARESW